MFEKPVDTQAEIDPILVRRWSGRAYDANRAVERQQIIALLEAARWAPSCYGEQPWRYIIFDKASSHATWNKAFACLAEGNQSWAMHAPILILALASKKFKHNAQENRWAQYDTGAATMSLCIQATVLGLMIHQMGGFNAEQVIKSFSIPDQYVAMAMLTVGYQLQKDDIPDAMIEREMSPRSRNMLGEQFFDGEWGNSIY